MKRATLACLVLLGVSLSAGPQREIPLNVSYRDALQDGVRSDGLTSFTGSPAQYVHGADDNALVIIQSTGNYRFSTRLDSRKPLRRRLCFDFALQQAPFASPQCVDALIGMHGDGDIQAMAYGEVLHKRTRHSWHDGVHEYAVGFGTDWDQNGTYDSPFTEVTCVAPAGAAPGHCSSWVMSGTRASLTRAKILGKSKFGPTEFIGYYDLPFEARFSR